MRMNKTFKLSAILIGTMFFTGCMQSNSVKPSVVTVSKEDVSSAVNYQNKIGTILLSRGELTRAKEPFLKAIDLDSKSADAYAGLAMIFQMEKDPEEAKKYYDKAVKYAPRDARINNNYGQFLYSTGDVYEACNRFEIASSDKFYEKRSLSLVNYGNCLVKTNKPKTSIQYFEKALILNPRMSMAYLGMSKSYLMSNKIIEAEKSLEVFRENNNAHTKESAKIGLEIAKKKKDMASVRKYEMMLDSLF